MTSPAVNVLSHPRLAPRTGTAALTSLLLGAFGLWLILNPDRNPLVDPSQALLRVLLGTTGCTLVLLALAVVGATTAALGLSRGRSTRSALRSALLGVAVTQVLGLGIALQSVSTIALAGYLMALALPVALVCLVVQIVRRYRRLRWPVLIVALALLVAGYASGALRGEHLEALARALAAGFARQTTALLLVAAVAVSAAAWTLLLIRLLQQDGSAERLGSWVDRHRFGLTLLAAAGPLPYALIRSSWLTPWPLLGPEDAMLDPETRLWGLLLGGAAALGCVLTVGLVRPWGVVFPRWMPALAGRRVPPAAAVVPGALVAGVVTASAAPMLRLTLTPAAGTVFSSVPVLDRVLGLVIFPFWIWGPALALAVWAYARSRR